MNTFVIGGGINGWSAAWHLARLGTGKVTLVEQHRIGHSFGSSHGTTRITRSAYADPTYARLVQQAHQESWPELEAETDTRLLFRGDGVFWGPGKLDAYAASVEAVGADVVRLPPEEARRRFPLFQFADTPYVLWDRSGGVVSAARAMTALQQACRKRGVQILEETRVLGIEVGTRIGLTTASGRLEADRLVICAGPWSGPLLEQLGLRLPLVPARQTVGYWSLKADPSLYDHPHFPVWVHLGEEQMHYGLPAFPGQNGIKAALHQTAAPRSDPDQAGVIDEPLLQATERFLAWQLSVPIQERLGAENCFYTNTPTEDFILALHPEDSRIVLGAGFSGHGFKFGPLTGRILAELLEYGRTGVPAFEDNRPQFGLRMV